MGQYFKFVNFDKKEMISPYDYDNLAKVMEHSYQGNKFLAAAEKLIRTDWKGDRVLYIGDYVDEYYNEPKFRDVLSQLVKEVKQANLFEEETDENLYFVKFKEIKIEINEKDFTPTRYIYNTKTQEYIDLKKQPIQWSGYDEGKIYGTKIHPLSILLCASNGAGGSYYGKNMKYVGHWVNSSKGIKFSDKIPKAYKELSVIFDETKETKSNIEILKNTIRKAIDNKTLQSTDNLEFERKLFLNENEQIELRNYAKDYNKSNKTIYKIKELDEELDEPDICDED